MTTRLIRHNGGYALLLNDELLSSLQIDPESELDVRAEGRRIIVAPAAPESDAPHEQLGEILESINRRYGNALRRLA